MDTEYPKHVLQIQTLCRLFDFNFTATKIWKYVVQFN